MGNYPHYHLVRDRNYKGEGRVMNKNKCDCEYHECSNKDDYTKDGNTCERCFMDCVKIVEVASK